MRTPKVLLAALCVVGVTLAACGSDDNKSGSSKASTTSSAAKLSGSIDVWIMDPGSPKIQSVVKGYATAFQSERSGKFRSSACVQAMCVHAESREIPYGWTPASAS